MTAYFLRRLLLVIPTMIGITVVAFAITRLVPGGPLEQFMRSVRGRGGGEGGNMAARGPGGLSPEVLKAFERQYDLDKPWYQAYVLWLGKTCRLDLGESIHTKRPVWTEIKSRFPISLTFGLTGFVLSYLICIPLGIAKALRHGSSFDLASSAIVFLGYSIPAWALGTLLALYLATPRGVEWFPLQGVESQQWRDLPALVKAIEGEDAARRHQIRLEWSKLSPLSRILDRLWHMALPVSCYMMTEFAVLTVLTKNSLMENLGQDYVRTAFAKGLSPRRVIFLHAMRNSLIPIATNLGHAISLIMAGSFLIEQVFGVEGLGKLGVGAILERNYPVMLGILTLSTFLTLLGNILADFLYALTDPRIRFD